MEDREIFKSRVGRNLTNFSYLQNNGLTTVLIALHYDGKITLMLVFSVKEIKSISYNSSQWRKKNHFHTTLRYEGNKFYFLQLFNMEEQ